MPLRVYNLTECIFNARDVLENSFGKSTINYRTENRKAKGKSKDYSVTGLIRASFLEVRCEKEESSAGKQRYRSH